MTTIRFTTEELDLFQAASHDGNPLHSSHEYARRTAYGGRVVYGVLNAIMALGKTPVLDRTDWALSTIECDFFDVAIVGVDYSVHISQESPIQVALQVSDGCRPILEIVLRFRPGSRRSLQKLPGELSLRSDAENLQVADLHIGQRLSGTYKGCQSHLERLCARAGLDGQWATAPEISALLWASYFVGMELPGKRALFSTLRIVFPPNAVAGAPFQYQAEVEGISDMGELSIRAELSSEGQNWARATIGAYVRHDLPPATTEKIHSLIGTSEALVGKFALVTGASRGLGASIVRALALHGCTVVMNFLNSRSEAEQVRASVAQTPGKILFDQGDVGDVRWCIELQQRMGTGFSRLDFLICNASPPLLPLWLQPSAALRINEFLVKSLTMVSAPTAALMPLVADSKGWGVMISSTAVTQIHPHFPHYSAAKSAGETIIQAAVAEYRTVSGLIVRPARLLTDLTNTPLGRKGALAPELVAASVVRRLLGIPHPGKVEVLDDFSST